MHFCLKNLAVLAALLFVLLSSVSQASTTETFLPKGQKSIVVKPEFYEDFEANLSIEDIRAQESELSWKDVLEDFANFGYRAKPFWYRFDLSNPHERSSNNFLLISYPMLDEVDYFRFNEEGQLVEKVLTGDRVPFANRAVDHPQFIFPVPLGPGEKNTVYLRVKTSGSQLVPITLWDQIALFSELSKEDQLHAVYFGIVLVIVFLNTLIFFALGERMYLYYAASTFCFMLLFAALRGKLYPYVLPGSPEFHHLLFLFLPSLSLIFSALFTRAFLNVKEYSITLNTLINLVIFVQLICIAGIFLFDRQTSLQFSVMASIPSSFLLLVFGPILTWMGNKIAWVYTLAWGTLMSGATVTALSKQGFIPSGFITEYGMQVGSAVEIFILTAALVYRFYVEHKSRVAAQAQSLKESMERREVEMKLLDNSMTHPVTMMPNRTCFEQSIMQAIRQKRKKLLIVCIENRRFNEVCKTLGQQNAELMLCELAQRYNDNLAKTPGILPISGPSFEANICSLESGSFGLILDQAEADKHQSDIQNIINLMLKPINYKDMLLDLQPVIGISVYPDHGVNASSLLRHSEVAADFADPAMQFLSYYRPEQDQYNARRLTMISELKEAISEGSLSLYFQPKLNLGTNKVRAAEALIRWNHKKHGLVRPDEFIPMAEKTGIITSLTRWVFDEALHNHKALAENGFDLDVAINLSAVNLREPDLLDYLKSTLEVHQIAPERIFIELTETAMLQEPGTSLKTLRAMRQMGLNVSVDDFGSGYSSLAYLKDLPVNEIKIDKSLITDLCKSPRSESVVKTTIEMCHELGFKVVAEGVEDQAVMERLLLLDCDAIQGFHLTAPLPLKRFIDWLDASDFNQDHVSE